MNENENPKRVTALQRSIEQYFAGISDRFYGAPIPTGSQMNKQVQVVL